MSSIPGYLHRTPVRSCVVLVSAAIWRTRIAASARSTGFVYTVNGHGDLGLQGAIDRRRGGVINVPSPGGPTGMTVLSDRGLAAGFAKRWHPGPRGYLARLLTRSLRGRRPSSADSSRRVWPSWSSSRG